MTSPDSPQPPSTGAGSTRWERIYHDPSFKDVIRKRTWFISCSVAFFVVYYFLLLVLVGYAPGIMERSVIGSINIAYLFALSQFVVGWFMMWLYLNRARKFDQENEAIIAASLISSVAKGSAPGRKNA
ncbi:MAG TPA: DUF485 domain-containing protein [Candidatus Baltobacteraceae bacterium]|nr:DUF485 domain-containing protein [Candidatus Baltobacteraceae bacterium]